MNKLKNENVDIDLAFDIVNNNFAVQSLFDDVPDGILSKHMSESDAYELCSSKKSGYYTRYSVTNEIAIIGIVPFNDGVAYVFNREFSNPENGDNVTITYKCFEELMKCYVFQSDRISEKFLNQLVDEYYTRGGFIYENYRAFENLILKSVRKERKREFEVEIIFDYIFKHGFREVGKKKWSDGNVLIEQHQTQRSSLSYPHSMVHTDLDTNLKYKTLIGSIFGRHYKHINQLPDNKFGIICQDKDQPYKFAYFEILLPENR